jgi:hypothetical protein
MALVTLLGICSNGAECASCSSLQSLTHITHSRERAACNGYNSVYSHITTIYYLMK